MPDYRIISIKYAETNSCFYRAKNVLLKICEPAHHIILSIDKQVSHSR